MKNYEFPKDWTRKQLTEYIQEVNEQNKHLLEKLDSANNRLSILEWQLQAAKELTNILVNILHVDIKLKYDILASEGR